MQHIKGHMAGGPEKKKDRSTERGEIMQYFMQKLNTNRLRDKLPQLTMGRMGKILQTIPTQDLYFLKSICDDAHTRGDQTSFSKRFWWEINPKNHTEEAKKKAELKNAEFKHTRYGAGRSVQDTGEVPFNDTSLWGV